MTCWLARFDSRPCLARADGLPDRCHLIPKQRLAKAGVVDVWASEWWVAACRAHHHLLDCRSIRLAEDDYPPELRAEAERNGFAFVDPRTGWVKTQAEEAA